MPELEHSSLISGHENKWIGRILVVLGVCALGAIPFVQGAAPLWMLIGAAALLWGAAYVRHLLILRRRRWLTVTPDGFSVMDRNGVRAFLDEGLICTSLAVKSSYTNGVLKFRTRTFSVWAEGEQGAEEIAMIQRLKPTEPDPLHDFMDRCTSHLHRAAEAAIEAGGRIEGEGWTLEKDQFVFDTGKRRDAYSVSDLSAVDIIENRYCVWIRGNDQPIARIPAGSANAHLLGTLLHERIASRAEEAPESASEAGLGRVLFERQGDAHTRLVLWLATIVALIGGIACGMMAALPRDAVLFIVWGVVLLGIAGAFAFFALKTHGSVFRCHVEGVSRIAWRKEHRLRYEEVEHFTYQAVRQFVHHAYVGTHLTLKFVPYAGKGRKTLKYHSTVKNADDAVDRMRDHVATILAGRMQREFAAAGHVKWLPHAHFRSEGLEYRPIGFVMRRAPILIRYADITSEQFHQGSFFLWSHTSKKPVFSENTAQPDFFPGYVFLLTKLAAVARERMEKGAADAVGLRDGSRSSTSGS